MAIVQKTVIKSKKDLFTSVPVLHTKDKVYNINITTVTLNIYKRISNL